ncbi:ImuA family protein [Roseomonas sp. CCTCC AB2023176]|uniref:ImuA family protein n=1 Tax=Roseomonas sp. CCTCC AB2023176 TaxID=3342640 RepID=UPI0035DEB948
MDRGAVLAALRARVARIGGVAERPEAPSISLCPEMDRELGGGLPRAALHEVLSGTEGQGSGAAAGFAALLLARSGGTVFWIARDPDAWPPGLARFGLPPSRLIVARPGNGTDALWAMEEALRCPAVSGVLLVSERPDPTAMRRLQLAAETGGGIGLLLRESESEEGPALATTRWRVTGRAGGRPNDLGDPQWSLELLRARGGRPARWTVTWRVSSEALTVEGMEEEAAAPRRARRV